MFLTTQVTFSLMDACTATFNLRDLSQATKINFESSSNYSHPLKASGVNVVAITSTGFTGTLVARKEVILSAGKPS